MLDAVIGGISSVIIEVAKCLAPPVRRHFCYMCKFKTNLDSLKDEIKKLTEEKESVHHRVDEGRRNGEEIEQQVLTWVASVEKIITEAGKIIEDEEKAKTSCFNLKTRYQLSKDAEQKVKAIVQVRQEGKFDNVSYRTIPQEIWIPATKGYESFESRISTLKNIEKALSDPDVNMVGVYGMGGIGKTTLVKEIAMKAEKDKLFDEVVFTHVSQTPETRKIQGEIADKLDLKLDKETESGRARKLHERLTRENRILIILDNVWTRLELEEIGIPFGDDHTGCKLLLTARSLDVLSRAMSCENNFLVDTLNKEETWSLFMKTVCKDLDDLELQSTAIDVANECKGLPIAIVTIARALRTKSKFEWDDALLELRSPSKRNLECGVQKEAYSCIELSYNQLESRELKSIFLLCGLLPNNANISDLLNYSMGLGLLQSVGTMEDARKRIYTVVHKLKAQCLLLEGWSSELFSMHDVVRDTALSIASRDQNVFTVSNEVLSIKWLSKDEQKNCHAIVLCRSYIRDELPEGLECPELKFFFCESSPFVKIPENFFAGMIELNVLVLTGLRLLSLPLSIRHLVNLRTLILDQCKLKDIAIIGELKKLEILSFRSSGIRELPKEICQLRSLKSLDLSGCAKLKVIPSNVISSLSQLEELYMDNSPIRWDDEGPNTKGRNASLHELKHLSHLTNLEIQMYDARLLPKGLFSSKLERYKILLADKRYGSRLQSGSFEFTRTLELRCDTNIYMEDIMQLKGIEVLHLDGVQGINNVLYEADKNGFQQLKHLGVENNPHFLWFVTSKEWHPHEAFPQLESLLLENLINLQEIYHGQLTAESFCKLKRVKVDNCDKLKNIFASSIVESLPQLQWIAVTECKAIEEIFAVGTEDDLSNTEVIGNVELGQLRFLILKSLPHLGSFCSKVKIPKDNEMILQDQHSTPTTLFNEMVVMPKLESLEVSGINCEKIWQNQLSTTSSCFQNLTRLILWGCGNLNFLFSSSTVGSFLKLRHLEICKCPVLREIIAIQELEEEERKDMAFPDQLNFLRIEDLENLTRFSSVDYIEFPSLTKLQIKQCPKLKAFVLENTTTDLTAGEEMENMSLMEVQPFFNDKVAFPELEEMVISHLDNLKTVWQNNKLAQNSFFKLKSINVECCDNLHTLFLSNTLGTNLLGRFTKLESLSLNKCQSLKNIFPAFIALNMLQLKKLEIVGCGILEEIVTKEGGGEPSVVRFDFPKATHLVLQDLPEHNTFYPGEYTTEWPVLENLEMSDSKIVKVFASELRDFQRISDENQLDITTQQPLLSVQKIFPRLEVLKLRKHIKMEPPFPRHFFSKLTTLHIEKNEAAVFSLGVLEIFDNLKTLELSHGSYKELFSYEDVEKHGGNFARIKSLHLMFLFNLKHMWKQDYRMNSILQNLEILIVKFCDNLVELVPSSAFLQNLTTLQVFFCDGMINLVTSSTSKSLEHLREMRIEACERMTEIVANEGNIAEVKIVFSKLKKLSLGGLHSLTSFCSANFSFQFPDLEELTVTDCPKMKIFCEGNLSTSKLQKVSLDRKEYTLEGGLNRTIQKKVLEVSAIEFGNIWQNQSLTTSSHFQNLKSLVVQGPGNLKYLFPSFIVKSFLQLKHLEICNCPMLNEIITIEEFGKEEREDIKFPKLNCLRIKELENLTRFCLENYVEFPSLTELEIKKCPKLKAFVLETIRTDLTTGEEVVKTSPMELQPFFNDKVAFPELEQIVISDLGDLKMIWHKNKLAHNSFGKLQSVEIESCDKLLTLFPSNMLGKLSWLECLIVSECCSLEKIFGLQESNLEEMHSMHSFLLSTLRITNCQSLKNIFPASMNKSLLQLRELEIVDCGVLKEIVAKEGAGQPSTVVKFAFQNLCTLVLTNLPALTDFYSGVYISEWPVLEELLVSGCEKVKVFDFHNFEKTNGEDHLDVPAQQPFFMVEKICPNLQTLDLSIQEITEIRHGQFPRDLFTKLKRLGIHDDKSAFFPLGLLEKFSNVDNLTLYQCSYKELFSYEDAEKHVGNLARIKNLKLSELSDLKHTWKQDSKLNTILQNLETLEVNYCDILITLAPPSASFQNLTTLKVCDCEGMINLATCSTANSLELLREVSVEACESMTEIMGSEGDVAEDEIIFSNLKKLSLVDLESIKSFCSANYTFKFPSLEILIVRDCPQMKVFCEGGLSTPSLEMVCKNEEDWRLDRGCWESDLNTTIQQLHRKEVLEVFAVDFEKSWQNQFPEMSYRFQNLIRLVVQGCGNLNYLFEFSIVQSFLQLQHLEICKCAALEEIIAMEELREGPKDIMFPQLKFLKIEDLENLTRFCTKMNVEFSSLEEMLMKGCPKFKVFVLENMSTDLSSDGEVVKMSLMELQPFFNDKVACPNLEDIVISHLDELKLIWQNNKLAHNSFCKLKSMEIEGCKKLLTLFPSNMHRKFSRLESLTINNCGSLEEIFGHKPSNLEETYSMPVFQLKLMSVTECQSLKNIFPTSIAKSLLKLEELTITDCGILEEIVVKKEGEPSTVKFIFPKVAALELKNLPALTNFYSGVHTSEWPMLDHLIVYGCGKAKLFASELLNFEETNSDSKLDIPAQQFFFWAEKICPNLEVLGLSGQEVTTRWHGQFPGDLFTKLGSLVIADDESAIFPLGLLKNFCNLEDLELVNGSYKELFSNEDVEKYAGNLSGIKTLWLDGLSDLKRMWKKYSKLNSILQNLETLHVEHCDSLINLLPSSSCFQNLITLEVFYCKGMKSLVTSSTAKSLEQLREMSIEGCKAITEIVADEEDVGEDEIIFNKLEELSLVGLESLTSFCSASHTFNFPSLEVLIVRDCPKMKIFCEGALSASTLKTICQNREECWKFDKRCWEGDLNATLQQLHNKMNVQSSNEDSGQPSVHHLE